MTVYHGSICEVKIPDLTKAKGCLDLGQLRCNNMKKSEVDIYRQDLSIDIISELSKIRKIDIRSATDIYYRSRLCNQIAEGLYGIDNLDYKYLAADLIENEPELFD